MRIVIDTNILISAFVFAGTPAKVLDLIRHADFDIIISLPVFDEYVEVLKRSKFDKYVSIHTRLGVLEDFINTTIVIETNQKITACRDVSDNKFLELATSGKADYIITGDPDLLMLNPFEEIKIITPAEFLASITE